MQPSKHSSWWRSTEDVLKTSWRRLQCNTFLSSKTSWIHNCKTSCTYVLKTSWKTSWRRLEDVLGKRIANTSWRRLEDIFKTSWKTKSVTLKTSSKRLEDVLENKKCLLGSNLIFIHWNFIDKIYRNLSDLVVWYLKR